MKVELIDSMGSDLSVVNAARVSFDKRAEWDGYGELKEPDRRLIQFLARGLTTEQWEQFVTDVELKAYRGKTEDIKELLWQWRRTPEHFAPFAHPHVTFRIKAPIFVARQLGKHQVGMVWSEVSRRYVSGEPEFYVPEVWRKKADNVKQGSSDEAVERIWQSHVGPFSHTKPEFHYAEATSHALVYYRELLASGVCPEQARMVLPQSMMTEWIWSGSLYGWANVYNKRKPGSHAQRECWPIAEQIAYHMANLFPVSWEALTQ